MSDLIKVCPEEQLKPGEREIVEIGAGSVGVFNINGEYYAISNTCCHQNGPLCEGKLLPDIDAEYNEPGIKVEEKLSDERNIIRCPWHGWTFDVKTGKHSGDEKKSVPSFEVICKDGMLHIEL